MPARKKRTLILALLALTVPLPALAISDQSVDADAGRAVAAISVSASLDTCGVLAVDIVCKINVSFSPVPGATSYSASVTAADGSVTDHGSVGAEAATLFVPYAGDGGYSVRIVAYGPPTDPTEADDQGEIIATGVSRSPSDDAEAQETPKPVPARESEVEAAGRDAANATVEGSDGALQTETAAQSTGAAPADPVCEQPPATEPESEQPALPEPPPEDLDPENPDEDADGILDADEKLAYDEAVAAQAAGTQAAVAAPVGC